MGGINQRQRFLKTLLGDGTDRFPFFDLEPDEDTLGRWRQEGFPRRKSVSKHFNLETHHSVGLMLRSYPFYQKAPDLLHDPSAFKRHYNPDQRSRYARGFVKRSERLRQEGRVLYVDASGGGLLQILGVGDWDSLVSACFALINRPQMVENLVKRPQIFTVPALKGCFQKSRLTMPHFMNPLHPTLDP